jgi:hypothetical protein
MSKQDSPAATEKQGEPLPIWFFVGLILLAYGALVELAALVYPVGATVLASLRPGLWWGAIMIVAGVAFLGIGLHVHRASAKDASK